MPIPEQQLETWATPGAQVTSEGTVTTIENVLKHKDAPYLSRRPHVFVQGSWGNDTNVWAESDVDIVCRVDSIFYHDLSALPLTDQEAVKKTFGNTDYNLEKFRAEVTGWLASNFGSDYSPGNRAVEIAARGNRRKADVLISAMFKRYYNAGLMGPQVAEGVKFLTNSGEWIVNYPTLHAANLTAKDNNTYQRLKPTIRIFKNMRNRMVEYGLIEQGRAPSYFIEGLLYNVPNEGFWASRTDTMIACVNWLVARERSTFTCANRQHPLLADSCPTSWKPADCTAFLNAVVNFWNNWD